MLLSIKLSVALLTLVLATPLRAQVVNDWSIPCTQGVCSWNLPAESGTEGWIQISGPVNAISDITTAAGWTILTTCNLTSSSQDIQIVCEDNNPDCDQLFQGNGAVDTIVRLPEDCGSIPFARVAQYQVVQSDLVTRDNGSEALVHQLTLDTDFAVADPSQGEVSFSLQGQNSLDNSNTLNRRKMRHLARQSNNAASVNWNGSHNLFSEGSSSVDIDAIVQASVSINVTASGLLHSSIIDKLGITIGLEGSADATLSVLGNFSTEVNSPNFTLYQTPFLGLSFPKIIEIGPQFTLSGSLDANFAVQNISASVEVNYDFGGTSYAFPDPETLSNTNGIMSSSDNVAFSAKPGFAATLSATTHLIPQVSLGLKALDGLASANVFLNVDGSIVLQGNATNTQACLNGNASVIPEIGAHGSFFKLFSETAAVPLTNKQFAPLFDKCFT